MGYCRRMKRLKELYMELFNLKTYRCCCRDEERDRIDKSLEGVKSHIAFIEHSFAVDHRD